MARLPKVPKKKTAKQPKRRDLRKTSSIWRMFRYFVLLLMLWTALIAGLAIFWFAQELPSLNSLNLNTRTPSVTIQAEDGTILSTYGDAFEEYVSVDDLPIYVPQALMAVEDRRFYHHFGIDFFGMARAVYANYKAGRVVQGGSTITQQLAKNLLFNQGTFQVSDRSIRRKILEALLSVQLEWHFTKDEIMTMYLNRVYLGGGTFGIEAASQRFFNKSARQLSVFESAVIAGLLKAPSRYSPSANPERAKKRAKVVLQLMQEAGFIGSARKHFNDGFKVLEKPQREAHFGYFCDWIMESLPFYVDRVDQDLVVVVTLDPNMQRHADQVTREYMQEMGPALNARNIALTAIAPSGAVKAMVGGTNYQKSQFNRVTQALRQPGSAFKMFVYLAAIEAGLDPDDMVEDAPITIGNWRPGNYTWKTRGEVPARLAFARSVNSVVIRLMLRVGPKAVIDTAHRLGITSKMEEHVSLALGSIETTPLEITSAFATFINGGRSVWPFGVLEVRNKRGEILYKHQFTPTPRVVSPDAYHKMRDLLREVIATGSGHRINIGPGVRGKTGSNGDRDAWAITTRERADYGFSNIALGVWVGNDDNSNMSKKSMGSAIPSRVSAAFYLGPVVYNGPNKPPKKQKKPNITDLKKNTGHKQKSIKIIDNGQMIDELISDIN